ncbi:hypothetical protein [Sandaracinus amylolyticus]|uniref:DUF8173 domain-containing protein n=1 Tax=Sandaracinus amylolyticus TaxID=927083 RepID=A0A0F6W1W4_9BACT|nr:hypothetical protein [Sandaracinus amylolyticus]AKF05375.1 hypothetical protein DB32_002524 [Sandaracinus amylolyticus]
MSEDRRPTELELEALAHGRRDLVREEIARTVDEDASLAAWIEREREDARETSVALKRAAPEIDDFDALIAGAMKHAPTEGTSPSRASLWTGAAIGTAVALVSGLASVLASAEPTVVAREAWSDLTALARLGVTLATALDRIAAMLPGGWAAIAAIGLALFAVLALPLRAIAGGGWSRAPSSAALVLAVLGASSSAHAYDLEGAWPEPDVTVSVDVERTPLSEALRQALASAQLGLAYTLPEDPLITLHVRDAPLREVLDALLADMPARVRHSGHLLVVRPPAAEPQAIAATAPPAIDTPPPPVVLPPPPPMPGAPPVPPPPGEALRDLVTFGGDARVLPDQRVRDVITMGGNARVEGQAFGSVVTMGGDADVRGTVVGDVVTMGGNIRIARGGHVHGQLNAMGGNIAVDEPTRDQGTISVAVTSTPSPPRASSHHDDEDEARGWIGETLEAAMRHALLFLLGLVFMGLAPARLSLLQSTLVKQPLRVLASGFLGVIAGAVLTLVLVITILGIPAAIVLALGLFLGAYLGLATTASVIGAALPIPALKDRPVMQLAVGVVILFVVSRVPVIGGLLVVGATLAGLGAVILTRGGARAIVGEAPIVR